MNGRDGTTRGLALAAMIVLGTALDPAAAAAQAAAPVVACDTAAVGAVAARICGAPLVVSLDHELARVFGVVEASEPEDERLAVTALRKGWPAELETCGDDPELMRCAVRAYAGTIGALRRDLAAADVTDEGGISSGPVHWDCSDGAHLIATYFDTEPGLAHFVRRDHSNLTERAPSGSGARYVGDGLEFWEKGGEARVTLDSGTELDCTVQG